MNDMNNQKKLPRRCHLPAELRFQILDIVAAEKHPGWSSCASVCKEWQYIIEKENFRRLNLIVPINGNVSFLDHFRRYVDRSQRLVQHIYLCVELPSRSCRALSCNGWCTHIQPSLLVQRVLWKFFNILSTWKKTPGRCLALDLNVYTPSDSWHWLKTHIFHSCPQDHQDSALVPRFDTEKDDLAHGWIDGRQILRPPASAIRKLFGAIEIPQTDDTLQVPVATTLLIRRQLRRQFDAESMGTLVKMFPRLQSMTYESWTRPDLGVVISDILTHGTLNAVLDIPTSVRELILFRDFDKDLMYNFSASSEAHDQLRSLRRQVGKGLRLRTKGLERAAFSYVSDARHFFYPSRSQSIWTRLQSLALTTEYLRGPAPSRRRTENIELLLLYAAAAALRMPELRTLAIWYGQEWNACAFIYRKGDRTASITWRGTWDLEFTPPVVDAWTEVADKAGCMTFQVKHETIKENIRGHADAIVHLNLPCKVVEPVSLWQMQTEAAARGVLNWATRV